MPVRLNIVQQTGWKTKNPKTRGDILVVQFFDVRTNKVLFEYAPKWIDIPVWLGMLSQLCALEEGKLKRKMNEVNKWKITKKN